MNVTLLSARRPQHGHADSAIPMYLEHPIAQAFGSHDPTTRERLMRHASHDLLDAQSARLVADPRGLRVLARCEGALQRVAGALRHRYGAALVAGRPEVRYVDGTPAFEPYMVVLVNAPARHLPAVRKDFLARGRITRIVDRTMFVLEGEAPLAELLGYYEHVRDMVGDDWGQSHVATWLSRYVPIDGGGPAAA